MSENSKEEADSCEQDLAEKASTNLALNSGYDRKIYTFAYVRGLHSLNTTVYQIHILCHLLYYII